MNYKNAGANKRQKHALRDGAGTISRVMGHLGATAVLPQAELRRLVAAMVD